MGRPRKAGNRDLPPNLYRNRSGWRYVRPDGRVRYFPADTSREAAVEAAKQLNAILTTSGRDLVSAVLGEGNTIADAVTLFRAEEMPSLDWGPKTKAEREMKLRRIEADIGRQQVAGFGVFQCAEFLKTVTKSPTARAQYRYLLTLIFTEACQAGWIEQNPALMTKAPHQTKKRERLTLEGFRAVYGAAGEWLRNAMDLALITLQRRSDVVAWRFADAKDGWLHVVPLKTEGGTGVRLRIQVTPELDTLIERCRDNVVSPFLVHRLPGKARPTHMRAKSRGHHTQVLPVQLSRAFDDARERCGAFKDSENPPTFHEIRSLGAARYREMGWPEERIQAIMGHADLDMTRHYMKGHERPWTEVKLA